MNREDLLLVTGAPITISLPSYTTLIHSLAGLLFSFPERPHIQESNGFASIHLPLIPCARRLLRRQIPLYFWNSQCQSLASCPRKCEFIRQRPCQISSVSKS